MQRIIPYHTISNHLTSYPPISSQLISHYISNITYHSSLISHITHHIISYCIIVLNTCRLLYYTSRIASYYITLQYTIPHITILYWDCELLACLLSPNVELLGMPMCAGLDGFNHCRSRPLHLAGLGPCPRFAEAGSWN